MPAKSLAILSKVLVGSGVVLIVIEGGLAKGADRVLEGGAAMQEHPGPLITLPVLLRYREGILETHGGCEIIIIPGNP